MPYITYPQIVEDDIAGFADKNDRDTCWDAIDQFSEEVESLPFGSLIPQEEQFSQNLRVHPVRNFKKAEPYYTFDFSQLGRVTFRWEYDKAGDLVAILVFATDNHTSF